MGCLMGLVLLLILAVGVAAGAALLGTFAVGVVLLIASGVLLFVRARVIKRRRLLGVLSAVCAAVGLVLSVSAGTLTYLGAKHLREAPHADAGQ